ncbi:hypothetical protein ATP_00147 [Candidatus Phytoplasma mali]|uniref:Uncharacterized protein n=1 Tax=Phytoplasma mali (strain AT) TaxID=482235 RepID=B3R0H0_PHYMT|nr:hypothetical protein [Candidatus Phytoplasma mali]CAP18334.1 hypothetical protein ATP_00147 [Candidatus Phytoplasma mali]
MNKIKKIKYIFIYFFLFSLLLLQSVPIFSSNSINDNATNYNKVIPLEFKIDKIPDSYSSYYTTMYQKLWEEICFRKGYRQPSREGVYIKIFKHGHPYDSKELFQEMSTILNDKNVSFFEELLKSDAPVNDSVTDQTLRKIMQFLFFENKENKENKDNNNINDKVNEYNNVKITNAKGDYTPPPKPPYSYVFENGVKDDLKSLLPRLLIDVKDIKKNPFKFLIKGHINWASDLKCFKSITFPHDVYINYDNFSSSLQKKHQITKIPELKPEDANNINNKFIGTLTNQYNEQEEVYHFNTIEIKKEIKPLLKYEDIRKILKDPSKSPESKQKEFKNFLDKIFDEKSLTNS